MKAPLARADQFCRRFGLSRAICLAPMAGVPAPELSIGVANAGGLGGCGVLVMRPEEILAWAKQVRAATRGGFQLNDWIPGPIAKRDEAHEARVREFLGAWGPPVAPEAGNAKLVDFAAQCEAMLEAKPVAISSIMGLYPPEFVKRMKAAGIAWFATITTVAEARAAEAAGADVIVAQGAEAGGHRGSFDADDAATKLVGLFALVPAVVDAVRVPVVATGGIADGRAIAAALLLGASAVQIGSGFLRCPESDIHPEWKDALARTRPEDAWITRAFSGRAGRAIANDYVRAAAAADAPSPAPYPVQRGLTTGLRAAALKAGDSTRMQAWAGQASTRARVMPASQLAQALWAEAHTLLE